jgi:hypothetical protein
MAATVLVLAAVVLMVDAWPLGVDFYYTYYPAARDWLRGELRLYEVDNGYGFYNTPWTLFLLAPLSLSTVEIGQSALNFLSLLCIIGSIHLLRNYRPVPSYVIVLAILTLFMFDLFVRGQIDALILFGVVLGWRGVRERRPWQAAIGFWLLTMKPVNVLLASLMLLIAMRGWPRRDQLIAVSLVALSFLVSCLIVGVDWPLRYLRYSQEHPPLDYISISIWKGASLLGFPHWPILLAGTAAVVAFTAAAWKVGATDWTLSLAVSTNLVFTNYAQGNHYILLIPAYIFVARADWRLGLLAYLLTWTPLLRLFWGYDAAALDVLFAVLLLAASWVIGWQAYQRRPARLPIAPLDSSLANRV